MTAVPAGLTAGTASCVLTANGPRAGPTTGGDAGDDAARPRRSDQPIHEPDPPIARLTYGASERVQVSVM